MAHAISVEAHLALDLAKVLHENLPKLFDARRGADGESLIPACESERRSGQDAERLGHGASVVAFVFLSQLSSLQKLIPVHIKVYFAFFPLIHLFRGQGRM